MSVKEIKGNLFNSKADVLCHQVNTYGAMGAGIAVEVRNRFPKVYYGYRNYCNQPEEDLLGSAFVIQTDNNQNQFIANCFGQIKWNTDYETLKNSLKNVADWMNKNGKNTVAVPYKMSCGLAGGDWNIVKGIIEDAFKNFDLEIWEL